MIDLNTIPIIDLHAQYTQLEPELLPLVQQVLANGNYILGEHVRDFEREAARYTGNLHAIGVANGTDALVLALCACGVGPGSEVITTPFTFFATVEAILQLGATPVFCDIDPNTFTLDVHQIESRITTRTKAILPVHIFGQMADMSVIRRLADTYKLNVVEDACQAIGARWEGHGIGTWGDAAAVSFFPTKNLGAYGDAGMILLSDDEMAARLRRLRVHGSLRKYEHVEIGWNSRLDELQAAILRLKLRHLDTWTEERRRLAHRYDAAFHGLPIQAPHVSDAAYHVYHLYTILTDDRAALMHSLAEQEVESRIYYPLPMHLQPALQASSYQRGAFPVTEHVADTCLSLPLYPGMTDEQQNTVIACVIAFFEGVRADARREG